MATEANDAVSPELSTTASSPTTSAVTGGGDGVVVSITDELRSFLTSSSTDSHLSEDLRDLSSSLTIQSTVPYKSLKSIWLGSRPGVRPDLSSLLAGSNFVFTSPTPRQKVVSFIVLNKHVCESRLCYLRSLVSVFCCMFHVIEFFGACFEF